METLYCLAVPHVIQTDCGSASQERCGAACVQMVLNYYGALANTQTQESIYDITKVIPAGEATRRLYNYPGGIARAVRDFSTSLSLSGGQNFHVFFSTDSPGADMAEPRNGILKNYTVGASFRSQIEALSWLVAKSIRDKAAPVIIAILKDNAHWVVINGCLLEDSPSPAIKSFYVRNPLGKYHPGSTSMDAGNRCVLVSSLTEDQVAYNYWKNSYYRFFQGHTDKAGFPVEPAPWSDRFFLICDGAAGETAWEDALDALQAITPLAPMAFPVVLASSVQGLEQISPTRAVEQAKQAVVDYQLLASPLWKSIAGPSWGLQEPYLVKRLEEAETDYYLVPLKNDAGQMPILIQVSAADGSFQQATVLAHYQEKAFKMTAALDQRQYNPPIKAGDFVTYFSHRQAVEKKLRGKVFTHKRKSYEIKSAVAHPDGQFAWKSCNESFSAFRPFFYFLATTTDNTKFPIYVPVDRPGMILTKLTQPKWSGL